MYPAAPTCSIRSFSFISILSLSPSVIIRRTLHGRACGESNFPAQAESGAGLLLVLEVCVHPAIGSPLPNLRGGVSIAP